MPETLLNYEEASGMRNELAEYAGKNLDLSSTSRQIFSEVYNKSLETGEPETIEDRMAAIAVDIASAELRYLPKDMGRGEQLARVRQVAERNLELYVTNTFRANTPTNINMGRWNARYDQDGEIEGYDQISQMGSACFVIPVEDTLGNNIENLEDGILEAWITQQLVHKGGGGTGFSFQRLRPGGSLIGYNPAIDGMQSLNWEAGRGVSSGYEAFLNYYFNQSTDAIKQGNSRRGANMGIQRIDHMDFLDHMFAKFGEDRYRKEFRMKNFNLSLAVTDEFMEAAEKDHTYTLYNPHRAQPGIKRVLETKFGVKDPEVVRKGDIATRDQFVNIMEKNSNNHFNPLTTPSLYIDSDGKTVVNSYTGEEIGIVVDDIVRIYAKKVLDLFSRLSHTNGEPGMVFLDRMNEFNANLFDAEMEATNPCGEQPLPPYDACNLGSINVGKFVRYSTYKTRDEVELDQHILKDRFTRLEERIDGTIGVMWFDRAELIETIHDGVRFLDNVIDRSDYPVPKIRESVQNNRNIGLGYMGVHDAMILMKMRYGSEESFEFAEELAKVLSDETLKASQKLAEERGAYPLYETSFHNPDSELYKWMTSNPKTIADRFRGERRLSDNVDRERVMTYGGGPIRNSARITQAPTGTISRSTGHRLEELAMDNLTISFSIEPVFSLTSKDNILNDTFGGWSSACVRLLHREGLDTEKILEAIKKNRGSAFVYEYTSEDVAKVLDEIPEDVRSVLVTSTGGEQDRYEITASQHIEMMRRFQRYNDSATSKTINLPKSASVDHHKDVWRSLWKSGMKGGTVYRDKSREYQILNVEMGEEKGAPKRSTRRPLLQKSITIELPYISSQPQEIEKGDLDFDPDRVFTTIAYNPINGLITGSHTTGIFQNIPEIDPERISNIAEVCISTSRDLKKGRTLREIIEELEKISQKGAQRGLVIDEAVMPEGSKEIKRFEVGGATTSQARLNSFYIMRFLTNDGTNFDDDFMRERLDFYFTGQVTLKSIINTRGRIEIKENSDRPSRFSNGKVLELPAWMQGVDCPECG